MNEKQILGRVQRTLILASGELAGRCGALFEERLAQRNGPTSATAVVALNGADETLEAAVAAALNRISPPDLAARLAQTGWQLERAPTLRLILLLAAAPEGGELAAALVQQVASQIYHRLGIEAFVLPFWLVGEDGEAWQAECFRYPQLLPLGNLILGMCNQDGLRLPDEASLCEVAAELLWCLTTTSLLSTIEQRQTHTPHIERPTILTAGLHVWTWSPEQTLASFVRRWLLSVLEQWLTEELDEDSLVNVAGWLQTQQLAPRHLAAYALHEREATLPSLPVAEWQMPWPWDIPALFEKSRFENSLDEEAAKAYAKQAQLRLMDPLQRARELLHEGAHQRLNKQPVAGIAQTLAWIKAIVTACEQLLQNVFDWDNDLNETAESLAVTRGELESTMQENLANYPGRPHSWLPLLGRPWRWPRLVFTYWHLQKGGQQLCQIFEQQAALRRERIQQQAAYQGMIELIQTARHLGSQVEEIGEMLHYLKRSLTAEEDEPAETTGLDILLTNLAVPDNLYTRLVTDAAAEATVAAAAAGGLGSQIRHLDDAILIPLRKFARSRLAALNQVTTAEIMLAQTDGDDAAVSSLLQRGWDAACPLWPVDAASLDETGRLHQEKLTVLCGSDTQRLVDHLPGTAESVFTLPIGWSRHLWLVRLHVGLAPQLGTAVPTQEVQTYE